MDCIAPLGARPNRVTVRRAYLTASEIEKVPLSGSNLFDSRQVSEWNSWGWGKSRSKWLFGNSVANTRHSPFLQLLAPTTESIDNLYHACFANYGF